MKAIQSSSILLSKYWAFFPFLLSLSKKDVLLAVNSFESLKGMIL